MIRQLLAAPYHLSALVSPKITEAGVGVSQYTPKGGNSSFNFGFTMNITSGSTVQKNAGNKLLTYPCNGIDDTTTNLRNESPDPVRHLGRDLRTNPIGQPVFILQPDANKIQISNVKFIALKTGESIPVEVLDINNDPYKGNNYELDANSAFILPLTDNLKSCETNKEPGYRKGNCGLYKDSQYKVSFDVMVDGTELKHKTITFGTK